MAKRQAAKRKAGKTGQLARKSVQNVSKAVIMKTRQPSASTLTTATRS